MPFDVMYPEKANEIKRLVLEYIKILRRDHYTNGQSNDINNTLQVDADGYPLAPRPQSWTKLKKADLEPLFRLFITRHYRKFICIISLFLGL